MPFVSRELLKLSLDALHRAYSPVAIVSLPCMLKTGVPTCKTAAEAQNKGVAFGSTDERKWLDEYFRIKGGPTGKPYFMPATQEWVQERYPDRTLQRRRKDFEDSVFFHPSREKWALRDGTAQLAATKWLSGKPAIPIVALMAWMWRDKDIATLKDGVTDFVAEMRLNQNGLIGTVYDDKIPSEFTKAGLSPTVLTQEDFADLTGAVPPIPASPSFAELHDALKKALTAGSFSAPDVLIDRIVGGWLVQDIVVLVGPPGCGKTTLARLLAQGLRELFGDDRFSHTFLEVTPQYDLAQFFGYENLAGNYTQGSFAKEVLFTGAPSDPRLVVLDEWNLAQIDSYFAPILSAFETRRPIHLPGQMALASMSEADQEDMTRAQPDLVDGCCRLPEDTFFIATCNSWQEEPESRLPISGPVKRRCRIITMPNILEDIFKREAKPGLVTFADQLLKQESDVLKEREVNGRSSILDKHRADQLAKLPAVDKLPDDVSTMIFRVAQVLLNNASSKNSFTPGILKDLLLSVVYAPTGTELVALGHAVCDKVLHQLQGDPQILQILFEQVKDLPNSAEISELIKRMNGNGTERRIRPLV